MTSIVVDVREAVAWITLDSPPVNALSMVLIDELSAALVAYRPPDVRAVVIRATRGASVFSAGHDVRELPTNGRDPLTYDDPLRTVVRQIEAHPAPVIAMVEGSVWGGACELVLSCDLVVAAAEATFALTPARLGVPYNLSGVLNLMKVADMHFVKEMLFTARRIPAGRMAAYGVLNAVVPAAELERTTADLAADIASTSPLVHRIMKEELRVLANAHPLTPEAYERIQALRREVYDSDDYQEGIRAFFEKRPRSSGVRNAAGVVPVPGVRFQSPDRSGLLPASRTIDDTRLRPARVSPPRAPLARAHPRPGYRELPASAGHSGGWASWRSGQDTGSLLRAASRC